MDRPCCTDGARWASIDWRTSTQTELTLEELQIIRLVADGLSNRDIAERLFVSRHTVGYHLHKVYAKLGITSRTELSHLGLGDDPG